MNINQLPQELQDNFNKENWMSITDAVQHVKDWIKDKNFPTAESWILEIEKFAPELEELAWLKEDLRRAKSANVEDSAKNLDIKTEEVVKSIKDNFSDDEKLIAAMSYLWFLAIVPLVLRRDSALCQHHWKQWLILAIFFFFMITISNFLPFLWWMLNSFISILQIVVAIYWWWQAYNAKMWLAPWIWDFMKKLKI